MRGFEQLERRELLAGIDLTDIEQYILEQVNWARAYPTEQAAALSIDLNQGLRPGQISSTPKQPLAPNAQLLAAARLHTQDMINRDFFDHDNPDGEDPGDRIAQAGYPASSWGENIAEAFSPQHFHDILFESPGHRVNIMDDGFKELGIGAMVTTTYETVLGTQNFASRNGDSFVTGVAYSDYRDGDKAYSLEEGLADIAITAHAKSGQLVAETITGSSGGYALQLPPGTYDIRAAGEGLGQPLRLDDVQIGNRNVKVDFVKGFDPVSADSFEANDEFSAATDLGFGDQDLSDLTLHHIDDSDHFRWTASRTGTLKIGVDYAPGEPVLSLYSMDSTGRYYPRRTIDNSHTQAWEMDVTAGQTYVLQFYAGEWAVHRGYQLTLDGPGPDPDRWESNETFAQATPVGSGDGSWPTATLHSRHDHDTYAWVSEATGPWDVHIDFAAGDGAIQATVYDASHSEIAQVVSATGQLDISTDVVADGEYYLDVTPANSSSLSFGYDLSWDALTRPVAHPDRQLATPGQQVTFSPFANDSDRDGTIDPTTLEISMGPERGTIEVHDDGRVTYTAPDDWYGPAMCLYTVADDEGVRSQPASITVAVYDPSGSPWQNPVDRYDVNYDGVVTPRDVLIVVNAINAQQSSTLPDPDQDHIPLPYLDVSGNDQLTPLDILLLVNHLNGAE